MPAGAFRYVVRFGRFAVKVPSLRAFRAGLECNRWEREMWGKWQPKFRWQNLCPVLFSDPVGLIIVMPWAAPVTQEEVDRETPDYYPGFHAESKPEDHGRLVGQLVVVDYGLPRNLIDGYRRQYERHQGPAQRLDLPPESRD